MGTNFYLRGFRHDDSPGHHLGKRSAAGMYCWDCKMTLCKYGKDLIHHGGHPGEKTFYDKCPKCGRLPEKESDWKNSAGRELGFNNEPPKKKAGVASCSSFSWAVDPEKLFSEKLAHECPTCTGPFRGGKVIENEYGDLFTVEEFRQILEECPVQFTSMIGQTFC